MMRALDEKVILRAGVQLVQLLAHGERNCVILCAVHEEYRQRCAQHVRPHIAVAQGVSGHNAVYRAERPDEQPQPPAQGVHRA